MLLWLLRIAAAVGLTPVCSDSAAMRHSSACFNLTRKTVKKSSESVQIGSNSHFSRSMRSSHRSERVVRMLRCAREEGKKVRPRSICGYVSLYLPYPRGTRCFLPVRAVVVYARLVIDGVDDDQVNAIRLRNHFIRFSRFTNEEPKAHLLLKRTFILFFFLREIGQRAVAVRVTQGRCAPVLTARCC